MKKNLCLILFSIFLNLLITNIAFCTPNTEKDMQVLIEKALQGEVDSQIELSIIFFKQRDNKQGVFWLEKAAKQNDAQAQFLLSMCLIQKMNNPEEGIEWLKKAAEKKHPWAMHTLGQKYLEGKLVEKDLLKALDLLGQADNAGNVHSKKVIKSFFTKDKILPLLEKLNSMPDSGEKFFLLGLLNELNGDNEKSLYLMKAAKMNHPEAASILGGYYYANKKYQKAIPLLKQAALQNNSTALGILGLMYEKGEHFEQDTEQAIKYFTQAANNYDDFAIVKLAILYDKKHDLENAYKWSRRGFLMRIKRIYPLYTIAKKRILSKKNK